jgi:hypothetical protein
MIFYLKIVINIGIIGLFLYSKLLPYNDKLNPNYKQIFDFFNRLFNPIFNFLKTIVKPYQVGVGLYVDMTQVALLFIFLLLLNLV